MRRGGEGEEKTKTKKEEKEETKEQKKREKKEEKEEGRHTDYKACNFRLWRASLRRANVLWSWVKKSYPEKRSVGGLLLSCDGSNHVINALPSYTPVLQTVLISVNSETRNALSNLKNVQKLSRTFQSCTASNRCKCMSLYANSSRVICRGSY